jgi:hypothetical protein
VLTAGDRVRIGETGDFGRVTAVHPHEVLVRISTLDGTEVRRYPHESVRLEPTMDEATGFIDH